MHNKRTDFMKNKIYIISILFFGLTIENAAASFLKKTPETPLKSHQPIKAEIIDSNPSHFTIDVEKFANRGANDKAPTFAVYISENPPRTCADFSNMNLGYTKPERYKRKFDLSDHTEILKALDKYKCIVVKNRT